ncbi:kinase-like protein, partial [Ceratobasidium sp. AG-I]
RELSSWSQLRYRSIAALLGLALFRGQLAMVSAWNHNGNVMKHIKEQPDVDRYVLVKSENVSLVHLYLGILKVHGDLKGANILVTDDGSVQLTDFGLTIMHDAMIQLSKNTNQVGGTLRWMAPELVFGGEISSDSEHASQSMSENLIEILTGKQPFKEIDRDAGVILALAQGKRPHRPTKI